MKTGYFTLNEAEIAERHSMISSAVKGTLDCLDLYKTTLDPIVYEQIRQGLITILTNNGNGLKKDLLTAKKYRMIII